MDKKIDIKITAADGVLPNAVREGNAIRNTNNWLSPLADELNNEKVSVELYLDEGEGEHLTFSNNISNNLLSKVTKELEKYQVGITGLKPNP